jgi:hypothetical protein
VDCTRTLNHPTVLTVLGYSTTRQSLSVLVPVCVGSWGFQKFELGPYGLDLMAWTSWLGPHGLDLTAGTLRLGPHRKPLFIFGCRDCTRTHTDSLDCSRTSTTRQSFSVWVSDVCVSCSYCGLFSGPKPPDSRDCARENTRQSFSVWVVEQSFSVWVVERWARALWRGPHGLDLMAWTSPQNTVYVRLSGLYSDTHRQSRLFSDLNHPTVLFRVGFGCLCFVFVLWTVLGP